MIVGRFSRLAFACFWEKCVLDDAYQFVHRGHKPVYFGLFQRVFPPTLPTAIRLLFDEILVYHAHIVGVDVPYLVKYDEGHGFHNEENRFEVYKAMLGFLKKYLG